MMQFVVLSVALLFAAPASAATLISTASGDINAAETWSLVDTTGVNAFLNSESGSTPVAQNTYVDSTSAPFTPASETISGFGVKLATAAGHSCGSCGTLTVQLYDVTSSRVACSQTVNVNDLPSAESSSAEGGWIVFACARGKFTANGSDRYEVRARTSVANTVALWTNGTVANWSRLLVTTGKQPKGPKAGDDFIVVGELTGRGTNTGTYTVTVNTTSNINYGSTANSLASPTVAIGQYGTLAFATSPSTHYAMKISGPAVIYNGGKFVVGEPGAPIPGSSTATLEFNATTTGQSGLNTRNGGTLYINGSPRTAGNKSFRTQITATTVVNLTTSLAVNSNTGWLGGDCIAVGGTNYPMHGTASYEAEEGTLAADAGASSLRLSSTACPDGARFGGWGGSTKYAHNGISIAYTSRNNGVSYKFNEYADVILLTRNVVIEGSALRQPGYLYFQPASKFTGAWVEFYHISGTAAGSRGLEADTTAAGSFSLRYFSFVDANNISMFLAPRQAGFGGTSSSYLVVQHGSFYNCLQTNPGGHNGALTLQTAVTNPYWKIDDIVVMKMPFSYGLVLNSMVGQVTNIHIDEAGGRGGSGIFIRLARTAAVANSTGLVNRSGKQLNPLGPFYVVGCAGYSAILEGRLVGTISGWYEYHNAQGANPTNLGGADVTFNPYYAIGEESWGFGSITGDVRFVLRNGFITGDTQMHTLGGIGVDQNNAFFELDNMELGAGSSACGNLCSTLVSYSGSDIDVMQDTQNNAGGRSDIQVIARNTSFLGAHDGNMLLGQAGMSPYSYVSQDCPRCAAPGTQHQTWLTYGRISNDNAIYRSVPYSTRLTPALIVFQGYISGTRLTATKGSSIGYISNRQQIFTSAAGFQPATFITSVKGTRGGSGNYTVNLSQFVGSASSPATFTFAPGRLPSAAYGRGVKVAIRKGHGAQVCVWVRESAATDPQGVNYNGDAPRLIERANPSLGVNSDQVLATFSGRGGTWVHVCGTTSTPAADGEFELVIDCDETATSNVGGWINIADWSASNGAVNPSGGQQFWFNGLPFEAASP